MIYINATFRKNPMTAPPVYGDTFFWNHVVNFKDVYSIGGNPMIVTLRVKPDNKWMSKRVADVVKFAEDCGLELVKND